MIRVAFDISSLNHLEISGVGVYVTELLKSLRQSEGLEIEAVWRLSRFKHRKYFKMHAGPSWPWLGGFFSRSQILHGPDFKVETSSRAKRVVTIHDVAFLTPGMTSPEFSAQKKHDLEILLTKGKPDAIAVVSEATKRELVKHYPDVEPLTFVTHLGGDHFRFTDSSISRPQQKYFLFVGNLEARKNVMGIIKAFEEHCAHSAAPVRLKIIGKIGFGGEEIVAAAKKSRASRHIDLLGYCTKQELENYYRQAVALVYPSWIEGFGLPVLEAMKLNCPVITSSTTSTAEVSGGHAFLVDPNETREIVLAMDRALQLFDSPKERALWIEKAKAHADSFTWRRCALATSEIYMRVLNGRA